MSCRIRLRRRSLSSPKERSIRTNITERLQEVSTAEGDKIRMPLDCSMVVTLQNRFQIERSVHRWRGELSDSPTFGGNIAVR
jgi:hypothetical protein